ncbi:MAG: hypothetical protein KTR22_06670 [Flavobacteriaceae bacterium]|nr:hypothetical protein [Flavobacteriaceae bacterium]
MRKLLCLICVGLLFLSCNEDDSSTEPTLAGTWNLVNVTCECAPVDFEVGEHVWNFNLATNQVHVSNNPDEDLQILDTGSYSFSITDSTITITSIPFDYFFEGEVLYLTDEPEVDGPALEFIRE